MKILYIVSTLKKCGPVFVLRNIVKNINRLAFQPMVLTLSPETDNSMIGEFCDSMISIRSLSMGRIEGITKGINKVGNFVGELEPDIIHTHGLRADYLSVKCLGEFPCISTIHNNPSLDYVMTYGLFKGNLLAKWHLELIRKMQNPVFCSKCNFDVLKGLNPNSTYIQNGVDDDTFKPLEGDAKSRTKETLGFSPKDIIILSVGHLSPRKRPETLIRGFSSLNLPNNFKLVFLGHGPLMNKCQELAKGEKNIIFKGQVDNVNDYTAASDIFVSASRAEGLPNAVLEAMACGLPVILSDIPPHKEILEKNSSAGVCFQIDSVDDFSAKLSWVVKNDLQLMGAAAERVIKEYFTAKIMAEKYQVLYRELSSSKRGIND